MSEYWHNGSIIFDRELTKKEKEKVMWFFGEDPQPRGSIQSSEASLREIHPLEYRNNPTYDADYPTSSCDPVPKVTVLDFEDYLTGRDFDETLEKLVSWCRENSVGIDSDSMLSYYGDDDGAYDFPDGELRILDRDEWGAVNCATDFLIGEVLSRKSGLKAFLSAVSTETLMAELNRRGIYSCPEL